MYLNPTGYFCITDAYGKITQEDTFTCNHCSQVCFVPAHTNVSDFKCGKCNREICPKCRALAACDVYSDKLDRVENTDAWLRARLGEKYMQAYEQPRREVAAIEVALRRQQMLKDMGF